MTNGSSQGLFVVVAVVIFGIFVAISYSLFRDQLSPALASIFKDSLYQTNKNISSSMVTLEDLKTTSNEVAKIISQTKEEILYSHDGSDFAHNIKIPPKFFKKEETYVLEYDIELIDGFVGTIGGHSKYFEGSSQSNNVQNFYIDGELRGNYYAGVKFTLLKGETHRIKVFLDTRNLTNDEFTQNSGVYIQPNRYYVRHTENTISAERYSPPYTVKITNLTLHEI